MSKFDLLIPNAIQANLKSTEKIPVIEELCNLLVSVYPEVNVEDIIQRINEREKLGSTGIGNGIAIPHCKMPGIEKLICCFGRSLEGVEFQAVDFNPANIFFLLVAPEDAAGEHLKALARISRMCQKPAFRSAIMEVRDPQEIYQIMSDNDSGN